jgi:serine/threonine protein kinase
LPSEEERERWYYSLSDAARLKLEDLYEYDSTGLGDVLGTGRFATVYPGRRRRKRDGGISSSEDNVKVASKAGSGILKKKPSFTSFNNLTVPLTKDDYECALKVIDKHKFWDRVRKDQERADSIVREISVQAALLANGNIYPGFLRVKSFFETLDKVVLELELLDGTDLFRYISSKQNISEVEAAHIMYDILSCLDAMKTIGIAHRDIKPANILMANKGDQSGINVKLGDFGMATFVGKDNLVRGRCGTPGYVAPEILEAKKNGAYENTVDMFSAGVLLYILLCGYEPFSYAESEKELINENKKAKVEYPHADWSTVSIEGRDLVEKMLERDPSKRIEPKKALQHPWITRRATQNKLNQVSIRTESQNEFACCIS